MKHLNLRRSHTFLTSFLVGLLLWLGLHGTGAIAVHQASAKNLPPITDTPFTDTPIQQGLSLYQNGNFTAAAHQWKQAANLAQQQQSPLDEALALNYLTLAYQELGQYDTAQTTLNRGLKLVTDGNQASQTTLAFARLLNTQGSLHLSQGKADAALTSWQKSATVYRHLDDRIGETGSLINQAQAEQSLGYFLRARNTLSQAEQLIARQPEPDLRLTMALNLGQMLTQIGEFDRAKRTLTEAKAIAQTHHLDHQAAMLMIGQGNLAYAQQQIPEAMAAFEQVIQQSDRPEIQLKANLNLLRILIAQKKWSDAQSLANSLSQTLNQQPPSHKNLAQRLQLSESQIAIHLATQKPFILEIAKGLQQAIQQARQIQDLRLESFAVGNLGRLYTSTHQWADAERTTREALSLAMQAHSDESCYRWKWQLGRILKAQGKTEPALDSYREAVEILQGLRQALVAVNNDLQYSFRDQVEPVYREYVSLLLQSQTGAVPQVERLKTAQQAIESLRLAELSYFLRSSCLEDHRHPITQQLQSGTALLYLIVLEDRVATLVSLPDQSIQLFSQSVPRKQVETTVAQMREALEKPYTAPEGKTLGRELYRLLVEPTEALLQKNNIKTLVFVPDSELSNVPLTTLYDGKQFLIERYAVAISPSLQLIAPNPNTSSPRRSLAAGLSLSRPGFPLGRPAFSPLAFVPDELKTIVQKMPGNLLLNEQFTSRAIANAVESSNATVLHFATHGQFSSNIDQTFIMAWDKPITLYDLKDLIEKRQQPFSQAIDLLVLSACETAAGDKHASLGLAGMAVQAGTRSTIATLWTVDDESSSLFMETFYAALSQPGTTKAEALRQAQRKLLKDPDFRHPLHWAPYVLVGNWL
jgi:CHAT domain-containing protein/predicted negative regulator of RcsB-dependent stress response